MIAGLSPAVVDFLREPRMCVMATINRDGTPQLTVMWYDPHEGDDLARQDRVGIHLRIEHVQTRGF